MRCLSKHRFWSYVGSTTYCFFIRSGFRQRSRAPFKLWQRQVSVCVHLLWWHNLPQFLRGEKTMSNDNGEISGGVIVAGIGLCLVGRLLDNTWFWGPQKRAAAKVGCSHQLHMHCTSQWHHYPPCLNKYYYADNY